MSRTMPPDRWLAIMPLTARKTRIQCGGQREPIEDVLMCSALHLPDQETLMRRRPYHSWAAGMRGQGTRCCTGLSKFMMSGAKRDYGPKRSALRFSRLKAFVIQEDRLQVSQVKCNLFRRPIKKKFRMHWGESGGRTGTILPQRCLSKSSQFQPVCGSQAPPVVRER